MATAYEGGSPHERDRLGGFGSLLVYDDHDDHDDADDVYACDLCRNESNEPTQSVQLAHKRFPVDLCRDCVQGVAMYAIARILMLVDQR